MQRSTGCVLPNIDPSLVRFYRSESSSQKFDNTGPLILDLKYCSFCFNEVSLEDVRIRLKPRMRLTLSVKKLLKKAEKNWTNLSKTQQHILKLYTNSKTYMIVTCVKCMKTERAVGFSRTDIENKRKKITKALITSKVKTNSYKEIITKTTGNFTSAKLSTPSSSVLMESTSKKKKQKIAHKPLQHLLSLEKKRNTSSSLKDFLSSMKL